MDEQIEAGCSKFIYQRENFLSEEECEEIIEHFHNEADQSEKDKHRIGITLGQEQFNEGAFGRSDVQVYLPYRMHYIFEKYSGRIIQEVNNYQQFVPSVRGDVFVNPQYKAQMTEVGGGFHVWHHEQGYGISSSRAMAWMIYLNDVDDGGETEFLYQHLRVKPKAGRMVIWPAGITHPHRGNPPLSNTKYILTGWYCYADQQLMDAINLIGN